MKKRIAKNKNKKTIAIVYHFVPKHNDKFVSDSQALVDNQTDEIVDYVKKLFIKHGFRTQIIDVQPHDLSALQKIKADYIYNLVDSRKMETRIVKILERLKVPFSGAGLAGIQVSNNKIRTKSIIDQFGMPTPDFSVLWPHDRVQRSVLPSKYPVIVKPAFEHCSIGITANSIATNFEQFKKIVAKLRRSYKHSLIIEEFIPGDELQVTVIEKKGETVALPIAAIAFKKGMPRNKWNIYGFDEKWDKGTAIYNSCYFVAPPPNLIPEIDAQIKRDCIRAFYGLKMRDYARFDLRFNPKKQKWYFLEVNANAGFDPDPRDAMTVSINAYGWKLEDFIMQIVKNSLS